jgi:AraC family transcriptional activator of pobA
MFTGDAELSAAALHMVTAMAERSVGSEQIAAMYLSIILLRLRLRDSAEGEQVEEKNRSLDSVFRYIFDYYNTDIKPQELAASVGYSYDRFRHIFKEKYGITPKQMILYKRLDAAKQQLRRDGKIENIARSCGFGSATQFNVIFKKTQGMTPSEYRAREKQG